MMNQTSHKEKIRPELYGLYDPGLNLKLFNRFIPNL